MNSEDEEFNRIERESKQRMEAVYQEVQKRNKAMEKEYTYEQGVMRGRELKYTWLPIELAPQDGTNVLVMYMHIDTQIVHNGFWIGAEDTDDEADIGWWSYDYSEVSRIKLDDWMTPTHWLPLPKLKENNNANGNT